MTKCPKCQGEIYNNTAKNVARAEEGKKLMPQYKCKDEACGWLQWPPKDKDPTETPKKVSGQTRPHAVFTLTALAEKMNEAYEVLQVNNIGESLITGDLLYKMAFTVLKDRSTGD